MGKLSFPIFILAMVLVLLRFFPLGAFPLGIFPPLEAEERITDAGAGIKTRAGIKKGSKEENLVYLVKVSGEIDRGLVPFISRVVRQADEEGARAVILEINTFGGRMDAAVEIRDVLLNSKTQTIAYINERAISAGALISLACQKITMVPGATIGAATPVTMSPFDQTMQPASEKVVSYFRKEMKATAEKNHRPALLAEAMVDPDVIIEGLTEGKKPLTLTASEALQYEVADFEISHGIDEILQKFDLQPASLMEERTNWAEKFLRLVGGSLFSSLLLTIGLLGLIMELRTPTWGIAGTVGLICLAVFFWGHAVLHLVGWEEIILLLIGTILLLLEALVIPGFGLTGILGLIALAAGLTLSLVGKNPNMWEIWGAVSQIAVVFLIVLIAFAFSLKFLARSAIAQRLVLHARSGHGSKSSPPATPSVPDALPVKGEQPAPPAEVSGQARREPPEQPMRESAQAEGGPAAPWPPVSGETKTDTLTPDLMQYLNQHGVAFTNLRPAGKAEFGKKRLNVITEGDFIEKGLPVRIIRVEGTKIIVQKIEKMVQEIEKEEKT
ncbi:MAG: NfeD family protein [bacterium]